MPRAQFRIRTLLWLTLVVAAFLGWTFFEKERAKRTRAKADLDLERGRFQRLGLPAESALHT
jgi:hypothetical protein